MHFPKIIILGLHFLLCQGVSSSRQSFFKNQKLSVEKVDSGLGKFLIELNKVYLEKSYPRQIMIIGLSNDGEVHSLIESYPYNICADPDSCFYSEFSISKSFVIVFLDDLSNKTLDKNFKILSACKSECEFLFVFEGVLIRSSDIISFLLRAIRQGILNPELAHLEENAIKLYRPFADKNCSLGVKLTLYWKPGTDLSKIYSPGSNRMPDLNGCPISVGTIPSSPQMVTKEDPNGSITIVGGSEGNLVLLFAEMLNFSLVVKYPSVKAIRTESRKESMINEAASKIVDFAIGRIRPMKYQNKIEFSKSYGVECITWGTPREMSSNVSLVWTEFPSDVWALIVTVFVISCAIEYVYQKMNLRENGNRKGFLSTVIDVLAINLGNPVIHIPISKGGKLIFILHLFYSTVVTTGYKTSLASLLTTLPSSTAVSDVKGIIEANLKIGGSQYNLNILKEQNSTGKIAAKIIERYEVIHDNTELMNRLKFDHDFACLTRRSSFNYEKRMVVVAQELITFDVFSDCFLTYSPVIVFRKGSFLRKPLNRIISGVSESGILAHWESISNTNDKILERRNADRFSEELIKQKFSNIFIFYFGCLCVCLLVFFMELLTSKLKPKKEQ